MFTSYVQNKLYTLLCNTSLLSNFISMELTDTDSYLPPDDPNNDCKKQHNLRQFILSNVKHDDCKKQHNSRQFNLLNVKQWTEASSNIQHAKVKARINVRVKAKRVNAFKCEVYAKKGRRVDRTVWNHNTLPVPITLDPLDCKNLIRHLNSPNNKILQLRSNSYFYTFGRSLLSRNI